MQNNTRCIYIVQFHDKMMSFLKSLGLYHHRPDPNIGQQRDTTIVMVCSDVDSLTISIKSLFTLSRDDLLPINTTIVLLMHAEVNYNEWFKIIREQIQRDLEQFDGDRLTVFLSNIKYFSAAYVCVM